MSPERYPTTTNESPSVGSITTFGAADRKD